MSVEVPEEFSVSAQREGSHATVTVTGELDLHSSSVLTDRLAELSDVTEIELDAGRRFIDLASAPCSWRARRPATGALSCGSWCCPTRWPGSSRSRASPTCCPGCRRPG